MLPLFSFSIKKGRKEENREQFNAKEMVKWTKFWGFLVLDRLLCREILIKP